jgi:holo-ACP synthase CitX
MNEILNAREERSKHIEELMKRHPHDTIVILKLNVVGPHKNPVHMRFMCMLFDHLLSKEFDYKLLTKKRIQSMDGDYIYYVVQEEASIVKERTMVIEDNHAFGRLVDIDVYYKKQLSRNELQCGMRRCLICDNYAHICARSQAHSIEEIEQKVWEIIQLELPNFILNTVFHIIYEELDFFPRFGLVSRYDNGVHTDMDFNTFLRSSFAIRPYLYQYIEEGINGNDPIRIQKIGQEAEKAMFEATNGVNTQKGLIFGLGILLPALSKAIVENKDYNFVFLEMERIAKAIIGTYYEDIDKKENLSHGDLIYKKYGIKGIRGSALDGFRVLKDNIMTSEEFFYPDYLMYYMSKIDDTTIVHRLGIEELRKVQTEMKDIILSGGLEYKADQVMLLQQDYVKRGISPGGASDLLVMKRIIHELQYLLNKVGCC